MPFLAWDLVSLWLLHVNSFGEGGIEIRTVNVSLLKFPVVSCSYSGDDMDGGEFSS